MDFISTKDAAKRWDIGQRRVVNLAREGRIPGARLFGNNWMIPIDAEKPKDGRTKEVKAYLNSEDFFRFPLFVNYDENSYTPPLSDEERKLRHAQKNFYACRFDDARDTMFFLSDHAENRYVRLSALYHSCFLAAFDLNEEKYHLSISSLNNALSEDFSHKQEMMFLRYELEASTGRFQNLLENFAIQPDYSYHPSAYYLLEILSFYSTGLGSTQIDPNERFETYELLCQQMEHSGHIFEAQELHFLLFSAYQMQTKIDKMLFHVRRIIEIAEKHDLLWTPALHLSYYPNVFRMISSDFNEELIRKISNAQSFIREKLTRFSASLNEKSIYTVLSNDDYEYVFLASQGYTNKEIARLLNVSEKHVTRTYSKIYPKLNIKSKNELVELFTSYTMKQKLK